MSETTLNLVAITIFTLVMSSLLGPLIHLSPAVPAVAAFAILGIATLDSFTWQGRLGAIVTDSVANFSPEHRARIIRHEAGHFLVAHLLGIPVTGYTLTAWQAFRQGQPGQGGVSFDIASLENELQQGTLSTQTIDRYCTMWMAGAEAEKLVYGNATGGADDRLKLRALWTQMRRSGQEADLKERWSALQAKNLLQNHWDAYEALVAAMENRSAVELCQQAIEGTKSDNPTSQI